MRILCLSGSPRRGGNTDYCVDYLARHLGPQPNAQVETFYLSEWSILPCQGCRACMTQNRCVIEDDDFPQIWTKLMASDLLLIAAPVYWLGPPGLMKNFIDRAHGVYALPRPLAGKSAYIISVAADSGFEPHEQVMVSWLHHYGAKILGKSRVLARELGDAPNSPEANTTLARIASQLSLLL